MLKQFNSVFITLYNCKFFLVFISQLIFFCFTSALIRIHNRPENYKPIPQLL